ncbi:phosphatase PAP2 family protein [Halobacillus salinarum]|uniref:Phosphatase PAP2 family protein n=1 Tax=Halobacillus salinarum TaxID=2932257 RepID=A0ABY4EHZ8_9BACI|nr:phosphatase PAP2 family protein [Halobacillus salinarum]UOQ43692.1 phosphatase PAP2 family protein [Halobacillus salinarum]
MLFSGTKITDLSKASLVILILGFFSAGACFYIFSELAEDVLEHEKFIADQMAIDVVSHMKTPWLDTAAGWITETGSVMWLTVSSVIVILYLIYFSKLSKWVPIFFAVTMAGISTLTKTLKAFFARQRPEIVAKYDATGFSFPSGHSTGSMVFYGFIIYLIIISPIKKQWKYTFAVCLSVYILLIGFSRVYLGVHYFTDILAGFTFGFIWLAVCIAALELTMWNQRRRDRRTTSRTNTIMK